MFSHIPENSCRFHMKNHHRNSFLSYYIFIHLSKTVIVHPALTSKIYSVYIKSVFWLFCSLYLTDSPQKSRTSPLPFYCTFLFDRYLPSSPPFLNCIQILLVFFSLIRIHFLLFACFSTHSAGAGAFAACSPLLSSTASPMLL